jgi:uncharacterized RDD family membrane protein YckC
LSLSSIHPAALDATQPPPSATAAAWKDEVSARVRAHRTRRGRVPENQPALPGLETAVSPSSIAVRVAERYARVPSYKEMLAAQAEAAAQAAQAAAAEAAHAGAAAVHAHAAEVAGGFEGAAHDFEPDPAPYQPDLLRYFVSEDSLPRPRSTPAQAHAESMARARAADLVDALEEAVVEPDRPLPARVIEFPRELVAPRKARPRLAEISSGENAVVAQPVAVPETTDPPADPAQLRIFEAEPEAAPMSARSSEWLSIRLDPETPARASKPASPPARAANLPLYVAPLADRLMAGVVDVALTLAAFLLFALVFVACTTHPPAGRTAVAGAAASLLAMWMLYQYLFFSLSAATPGMRYAKIALCTFDDENPSRHAMRVRIAALLLSALPLGLGFLWIFFDEDGLGWHDRITQTYQRSYRSLPSDQ